MRTDFLKIRSWAWAGLILSMIGLALVSAFWASRALPQPVVLWMLDTDTRTQAEVWRQRVLLQIQNEAASFASQSLTEADQVFLNLIPKTSDIYRIRLFSNTGQSFWSTNPEKEEDQLSPQVFQETVSGGDIHIISSIKPASEIDGLSIHSLDTGEGINDANIAGHLVYEVFTPVFSNGEFVGAIEFFTDVTDVYSVLLERVRQGVTIASAVLTVFMTIAATVMLRTSMRQMRHINKRNREERELLESQMQLTREVKLLGELNEWLQSSRSLSELFQMVIRFMTHMLPECSGSIYVYSNSRDVLDGVASWNDGNCKKHIHPEGCWGLRRGRTYTFGTSEVDFVCEHAEPHDDQPYFCFPILAHGETVGLMHLKKLMGVDKEQFFSVKKLAQMSAEQISMAVANVRMRDQLQEQSIRDPLTGLYNRRHMLDRLRRLLDLGGESGRQVHLVYLDIDHFKRFNDTHGHDAGDYVLRAVGEVLENACSGEDVACRMGGEEFMLIWPNAADEELRKRTSSLLQAIADISLKYSDQHLPKITASLGVASSPEQGHIPQTLMRAADDAMYLAKANGRNRVEYAGEQMPTNPAESLENEDICATDMAAE